MNKKIILLYLIIFLNLGIVCGEGDHIGIFFEEIIEGKKTGNFILFQLSIYYSEYNKNKTIKWILDEVRFNYDPFEKITDVSSTEENSSEGSITLKNIKWERGKRVECIYDTGGGKVLLILEKVVEKGESFWKVLKAKGTFKSCDYCEDKEYELIGKKNIKLKTKTLGIKSFYE